MRLSESWHKLRRGPLVITEKELNCIERTLLSYRMKNMFLEVDETEHYPLLDLLSQGGKDVSTGKEEIENIMDSIYLDLIEMYETEQRTTGKCQNVKHTSAVR
jgi:hypothetical protein